MGNSNANGNMIKVMFRERLLEKVMDQKYGERGHAWYAVVDQYMDVERCIYEFLLDREQCDTAKAIRELMSVCQGDPKCYDMTKHQATTIICELYNQGTKLIEARTAKSPKRRSSKRVAAKKKTSSQSGSKSM